MKTTRFVFAMLAAAGLTSGTGYAEKSASEERRVPNVRRSLNRVPARSKAPKEHSNGQGFAATKNAPVRGRDPIVSSRAAKSAFVGNPIIGGSSPARPAPVGLGGPPGNARQHRDRNPAVISGSENLGNRNAAIGGAQALRRH